MKNLGITLKQATLKKLHNFQVHTIFIGLSAVASHSIPFLSVSPPDKHLHLMANTETSRHHENTNKEQGTFPVHMSY